MRKDLAEWEVTALEELRKVLKNAVKWEIADDLEDTPFDENEAVESLVAEKAMQDLAENAPWVLTAMVERLFEYETDDLEEDLGGVYATERPTGRNGAQYLKELRLTK